MKKNFLFHYHYVISFFFLAGILFAYYFLILLIWNFFISYENFLNNSFPIELESKYSEYIKLTMFLLLPSGLII